MFRKIDYAMIMVSDMTRAVRFYRDTLGFRLRFQSDNWTEFETEGTTLALHGGAVSKSDSQQKEREPVAGTVSLGLSVPDLDETAAALKARGVRFIMEPTIRQGEGIKLAVFVDPDGLAISVAQALTKR